MRKILLLLFILFNVITYAQDYEYKIYSKKNGLSSSVKYSIAQDFNGYLWIGTSNGLVRFDGESFITYRKEDGLLDTHVNKVFHSDQGVLWLKTRLGVQFLKSNIFSGIIDTDEIPKSVQQQLHNDTITLLNAPFEHEISDTISFNDELVVSTYGDGIWINTSGNWIDLGQDYYFGRRVYDLFIDKDNILWVASNVGLTRVSTSMFQKFPLLQTDGILEIVEHDNLFWFASHEGIYCIDSLGSKKHPLEKDLNYMICLGESHKGNLQAAGLNGVLYEWNGKSFKLIDGHKEIIESSNIFDIEKNNSKTYYACRDKIMIADGLEYSLLSLGENQGNCYDIQSFGDSLFFACSEGLFLMVEDSVTQYTTNDGLTDNYCRVLELDDFGNLWIGTYNEGVIKYDGENFESITTHDGLSNNLIKSLEWDRNRNSLWVGTDLGLNQLVVDTIANTVSVNSYNPGTGHQFLYCHNKSLFCSDSGTVLFSVNTNDQNFEEHIYTYSINDSLFFNSPPNTLVDSIQIWDNDAINQDKVIVNYSDSDPVELNYFENNLNFHVSAIHLTQGEYINYQWYLEGYDKRWRSTTKEKVIHYTNLPSGTYKFHVRAKVPSSVWSGISSIQFSIKNPFWEEIWFLISIVTIILFAIFKLIDIRQKRLYNKNLNRINHQRVKAELELKALRAQLNPHFIFNVLNSIQYLIYENNGFGIEFVQNFALLMRKSLLYSRKTLISLKDEIEFINLYVQIENVRFEIPFNYQISLSDDVDDYRIFVPPLIFQPYIENAIKHGLFNKFDQENNRLIVRFEVVDLVLRCVIEDNGVGRAVANAKKNKQHNSQGLLMMQERIDYLNVMYGSRAFSHSFEDVKNASDQVVGTRVIICIPINLNK